MFANTKMSIDASDEFQKFQQKHSHREFVDADGYLEPCTGIHEDDLPRYAKTVLAPKHNENVIKVVGFKSQDKNFGGDIDRLPQNILISGTYHDFSAHMLEKLTSPTFKASSLRIIDDIARFYDKELPLDKPIIKWKVNDKAKELVCQLGKWPESRSEFKANMLSPKTQKVISSFLDDHSKDIALFLHLKDTSDNESISKLFVEKIIQELANFEDDSTLWFQQFEKKFEKHPKIDQALQLIKEIVIEPRQGFYNIPIVTGSDWTTRDWTKHQKWQHEIKYFTKKNNNIELDEYECFNEIFVFENLVYEHKNLKEMENLKFDLSHIETHGNSFSIKKSNVLVRCKKENFVYTQDVIKSFLDKSRTYSQSEYDYESNAPQISSDKTIRTQLSKDGNETRCQISFGKFTLGNSGFIYTTDEGIRTGFPFTHCSSTMNMFTTCTSTVPDNVENYMDSCTSCDLTQFLNSDHQLSILSVLHGLRHTLAANLQPKMLVFYSKKNTDYEESRHIVNLRCRLMGILKAFPVVFPNALHSHVPEWERLIHPQSMLELVEQNRQNYVFVFGQPGCRIKCPLVDASSQIGRAFPNAIAFNAVEMSAEEFKASFVEASGTAHVHLTGKKVIRCKTLTNEIWTHQTTFKFAGKTFKNQLKPFQIEDDSDDSISLTPRCYVYADMIPLQIDDTTKYIPNRKFDDPILSMCPIHPVYKCTKEPDMHMLMRPFPTKHEIESMIEACETRHHIFDTSYDAKLGCHKP